MAEKVVASNRRARHEYFILKPYEAGIPLQGSEIKSIRAGQISLAEAYVRIDGNRPGWKMPTSPRMNKQVSITMSPLAKEIPLT